MKKSIAVYRPDGSHSHFTTFADAFQQHKLGQAQFTPEQKRLDKLPASMIPRGEQNPWKVQQSGNPGPLVLQMVTR